MDTSFIKEDKTTVSTWTHAPLDIKNKYLSVCGNNSILINNFISEINKTINSKKFNKRYEVERIVCGSKILKEKHFNPS